MLKGEEMTRQSSDDMSDKHEDIQGENAVICTPGMGETALMDQFCKIVLDNTAFKIELRNDNLNTFDSEPDQKIINS